MQLSSYYADDAYWSAGFRFSKISPSRHGESFRTDVALHTAWMSPFRVRARSPRYHHSKDEGRVTHNGARILSSFGFVSCEFDFRRWTIGECILKTHITEIPEGCA